MLPALPLPVSLSPAHPVVPEVAAKKPLSHDLRRSLYYMVPLAVLIGLLTSGFDWRNPLSLLLNMLYAYLFSGGLAIGNNLLANWLGQRVSWTQQPTKRFWLSLTLTPLVSAAIIGLVDGSSLLVWHLSGHKLLFHINWWWNFWFPLLFTSVISVVFHASSFLDGWREAAVRAERLEKETAVARLDSLRRQVDPHFLFNSLNALTSLVEETDPARAVRFIRQLSQVYRYVLDSESQELVPLAQEVAFAESYLYLQKTRLGDALAVEMDLPPAALHAFFVPPLALQLLLENVVKHNAAFQAQPLHVSVTLDAAAHTLTVRNTRRPRRLAPGESSGLGLKNLAARYAFLTDKPLAIGEEAGEFVVTLPLLVL